MSSKLPAVLGAILLVLAVGVVGVLAWARSGPAPEAETAGFSIPPIDAAAPETETATFALG